MRLRSVTPEGSSHLFPFRFSIDHPLKRDFRICKKALITRRFIKIKQGMKWNCSMKYSKEEKQMSKQRSSGPHRRILVRLCALALIAAMLLTSAYAGGAVESGPAVESLATENLDVQNTAQPRARRLRKARRPKPTPRRPSPANRSAPPPTASILRITETAPTASRSM